MKKEVSTNNYIFDTDCLSTFLITGCENILLIIFNNIIIPQKVYNELCKYINKNGNPIFKDQLDKLKKSRKVNIYDINLNSNEAMYYYDMTIESEMQSIKIIGQGEAACIAYAIEYGGIICSNNLSDIKFYIEKYNLEYYTTADIFCIIYNKQLLSWQDIEMYWNKIQKHSKLPTNTFVEYYQSKK